MDKEIIIDGVKVEECSYYNKDNTPYCCEVWDNECEAQNCYYKQLKRLQQDYVNLSKAFEHLKTSYQENQEYVLPLKDENASLKNERTADLVKQIDELKAENEALIEGLGVANKYVNKYHQTLQEIKAIAEKRSKEGLTRNYYKGLQQIIDLITKAEEE